ncbi:hypothetical protein HNP99_002180 [Flavobacterium sp. 28A]|uniref:DUF3267 domain-containing protein n=1 Tax=Flavobacterium sp. 28A TaxID=2735895 RepID=UPI00156EE566|nr:DUF3267 domain-containing protein [Flavobacterium sp. 28A]NRT15820.1 hypothetical protein [Flavobacterium sp. 28A]
MDNNKDYTRELITFNLVKANLYAIFSIIPILIIYLIPYYLIWNKNINKENIKKSIIYFKNNGYLNPILIFTIIISTLTIGIILHELIHGITWAKFTKDGFKSIKFGVLWRFLTPYCHCKEPLLVKHYIIGGIMPTIILGVLPVIISFITGNILFLIFGIFFTMAAFGDFIILFRLIKENKNNLVLDHPSEVGCYIYRYNKL